LGQRSVDALTYGAGVPVTKTLEAFGQWPG
jgi:hypothetical protein